ncbi:MAG: MATE family efflux transporter [Pseudomonadota bacterium]
MSRAALSHMAIFRLAVPVMLAQAAIAATGVVDTLIIGLTGDKDQLAAVGVASVVFSFIYWGFGFLRMSTTGLVAQAQGAGQMGEVRAVLQRAILLGALIGALILLVGPWLQRIAFMPFHITASVQAYGEDYFDARIWGAPALLMGYGVSGFLLGAGRTGALLAFQIVVNAVNIVLDVWFVVGLGLGPGGIGAGTAIAEWCGLAFGLVIVFKALRPERDILDRRALLAVFQANRDILIRTLALLFCFAWFARSGSMMGTAQLAGNEVLLQFIAVAAFVLDGFAFVAEKEVGQAFGARDPVRLRRAMRVTSELALVFGALIALAYLFCGALIIERVIADAEARAAALAYLPFCALAPLIGVVAWQLDGFFLGATRGPALRTAGLISAAAYVATDAMLRPALGNSGVWSAFLLMYVYRAGTLAVFLPGLIRESRSDPRPPLQPQS